MHVMISVNTVVELSSKVVSGILSPVSRMHPPEEVLAKLTVASPRGVTKISWSSLPSHTSLNCNDPTHLFEKQATPLLQSLATEHSNVGCGVGEGVGDGVGAGVRIGAGVGAGVGFDVGESDGDLDGVFDGDTEFTPDGNIDGKVDGMFEGGMLAEGDIEGEGVGYGLFVGVVGAGEGR